jgi:Flp pilus assembly protein TadD
MGWNPLKRKTGRNLEPDRNDVEYLLLEAIESFENHDHLEAIKRFQLIIKLYPEHPMAHLMLGRGYVEIKDFSRAIGALHDHLQIIPHSEEAMIYLGIAYFECKELALARTRFEEAIELKANSMLARENLIITKMTAGRLEEALVDLLRLRKERPGDKDIVELVVLTLGKMGKWEIAKRYLHQNEGTAMLDTALALLLLEPH